MKPKLNAESFTKWAIIEMDSKWQKVKQQAKTLGRTPTWLELVEGNFAVDEFQAKALKGMSAASSAILQSAAEQTTRSGGTVRVGKTATGGGQLIFGSNNKPSPGAMGSGAQSLSIGIAHCTFDADCTNWQCDWGPG